jgi:hypothetical protein
MKDHFSHNIPRWNAVIMPHLSKIVSPRILLVNPSGPHCALWLRENLRRADIVEAKMKRGSGSVMEMLAGLKAESFDLIYIDLGPDARFTMEAAVMTFPLLKARGIMAFDDYTHDKLHGARCPKPAIDRFADIYARYIKVLHASWEFVLMKRTRPLASKVCASEFYHENVGNI